METAIKVNRTPALTWNALGINDTELSLPSSVRESELRTEGAPQTADKAPHVGSALGSSFDGAFDALLSSGGIPTRVFTAGRRCHSVSEAELVSPGEGAFVSDIIIKAAPYSNADFVFMYKSALPAPSFFACRIRCALEEGARVHVAVINLLDSSVHLVNSISSLCGDDAQIEISEVNLGAARVESGTFCALSGVKSRFSGQSAYIARSGAKIDINQIARQTGRETESRFTVDGVLYGGARKTWRGTIDFRRGCSESRGREEEDVLLLDEDVVNKSLPIILCDEEAVEGSHACSIGRIDDKKLFYMQSRGLGEKDVVNLLSRAKVQSVLRRVASERARRDALAALGGEE